MLGVDEGIHIWFAKMLQVIMQQLAGVLYTVPSRLFCPADETIWRHVNVDDEVREDVDWRSMSQASPGGGVSTFSIRAPERSNLSNGANAWGTFPILFFFLVFCQMRRFAYHVHKLQICLEL